MYKIIGADQKEYGPVTAEQLRQWLAEGRVNAQTSVWAEGSTEWKPFAAFPEFADILASNPEQRAACRRLMVHTAGAAGGHLRPRL